MTIKGIRSFEKKFNKLLRAQKIIVDGKYFTKNNILDISGFLHKIVVSAIGLDNILHRLKTFIDSLIKEDDILHIVFDPIQYLDETSTNPYKNIKLQEIQRRQQQKDINGLTIKQITQIKKLLYYFVKEQYEDNKNIKLYVSQIEADIMIGSLIRKIEQTSKDITIISTDCDMYVIGYGYIVQNLKTMTDTKKFFDLFGISGRKIVCCIPQYLGCDYNDGTHQIETIYLQNFIPEGIIFNVFYKPQVGEDNFELNYQMIDWKKECQEILTEFDELSFEELPLNELPLNELPQNEQLLDE